MKAAFLIALAFLLAIPAHSEAFAPELDLMMHDGDGALISVWGEHSWDFDTSSWGYCAFKLNGHAYIGSSFDPNTV